MKCSCFSTILFAAGLAALALPSSAASASFVPGALSPGPYGVCAHMTKDAGFAVHEEECRWIAAAGIGRARIDFPWWMCQPVKDGAVDFSRFDAVVEAAERVGVTPLPIIWSHVDWAHPEGGFIWSTTPPERLAAWGRLVEAIVAHYGDRIPEYEIWNEQNIAHFWPNPNPTNYLAVLRTAHEAAHRANPRVRILFGGTAGVPLGFIEEIYRLGGADAFDVMNIHPYTHPKPPEGDFEERIAALRALMAKYGDGDKPIVITEHGWPTHDARAAAESGIKRHGAAKEPYAADETDQARYLVRSVALAMAEGIEAYYWFELRGVESDPAYSEHHFGLMHSNLTPKPAYGAYANFTKMRPAGSVQSQGKWKDPASGLYFPQWTRPDGTPAGVLWKTGAPESVELVFSREGAEDAESQSENLAQSPQRDFDADPEIPVNPVPGKTSQTLRTSRDAKNPVFRSYTGCPVTPSRTSFGAYVLTVSESPVFFEGGALDAPPPDLRTLP